VSDRPEVDPRKSIAKYAIAKSSKSVSHRHSPTEESDDVYPWRGVSVEFMEYWSGVVWYGIHWGWMGWDGMG
jgi:hypothetical protein